MDTVVLDAVLALTPERSRDSIDFPFRLDRPAERLLVDFSYEPKAFSDREASLRMIGAVLAGRGAPAEADPERSAESFLPLLNLVTISLDYDDEYIGCAHRHDPVQRHSIGAAGSSPGFLAVPARAGDYRLVVNAHCVLSPACELRLRVVAAGTEPER